MEIRLARTLESFDDPRLPEWAPAIEGLRRVERGEVSAREGGLTYMQGGGIGWWTPVGRRCSNARRGW